MNPPGRVGHFDGRLAGRAGAMALSGVVVVAPVCRAAGREVVVLLATLFVTGVLSAARCAVDVAPVDVPATGAAFVVVRGAAESTAGPVSARMLVIMKTAIATIAIDAAPAHDRQSCVQNRFILSPKVGVVMISVGCAATSIDGSDFETSVGADT